MKVTLFLLAMSVLGIHFADRPVKISDKKQVVPDTLSKRMSAAEVAKQTTKQGSIVELSGDSLNIKGDLSYKQICDSAARYKCVPCPPEVVKSTPMFLQDYPVGTVIYIAVEPMKPDTEPCLFKIQKDGVHDNRFAKLPNPYKMKFSSHQLFFFAKYE
ncbi:MAG TPA: hypothetical protein VL576_02255 [Candidatus Paceibacterota bacterium]|jgi:hypothetical protein|nr:hypothetical protein [Candidatus Paceibacterota bacterium]